MEKTVLRVYTIYDAVMEEHGPPFVAKSNAVACRMFQNLLKSDGIQDASDLSLWRLGTWEPLKGLLVALRKPEKVLAQVTEMPKMLEIGG